MTTRRIVLLVTLWLAVAGLCLFLGQRVQQRRAELGVARSRAVDLAAQAAQLKAKIAQLAQEVTHAEQDLASLPPPATSAADATVTPERQDMMAAWMVRLRRLHQLFDERADQRIPEMRLLTDADWLRVAKRSNLDTTEGAREALAAIRTAAAEKFVQQLSAAVRRFAAEQKDAMPATVSDLVPFFDPPADADMLVRYQVIPSNPRNSRQPRWGLETIQPIDSDFDMKYTVRSDGGWASSYGPWAWEPNFRERYTAARQSYAEAAATATAPRMADLIPYFNPPLSPELAAKVIAWEKREKR